MKNFIAFTLLIFSTCALYKLEPHAFDYDTEEFLALDHGDDAEYMENLKQEKEDALELDDVPCEDDYCS